MIYALANGTPMLARFYSPHCTYLLCRRGVSGDGRERQTEQESFPTPRAWHFVLQRGAANFAVHLQQAGRGSEVKI